MCLACQVLRIKPAIEMTKGSFEIDTMEIVEFITEVPVQNPSEEVFSSADLNWTKYGTTEHNDDVALIPYDRVDAFKAGESTLFECPTQFHVEQTKKRVEGSLNSYKSDEYLEYKCYWCSFGPENYREDGEMLHSRRYRLNTRNRAAIPQSMRGCTCHFVVKRLYARPSVALVIYNNRRKHINNSGSVCHGPFDGEAIGPGAKKTPYYSDEIQQQVLSMLYCGIPKETVLHKLIQRIQHYYGSNAEFNSLLSKYVDKIEERIERMTHELDPDDQTSIRLWTRSNKKDVFFYQDSSDTDAFVLGIQTKWQLQQMIRFGRHGLIAVDSTSGIKKLKYPLCTLVVFDSRQHALPVAWVITRSVAKQDVYKWMKALLDRVRVVDPSWKINGFLIDDAALELHPIRDIFQCPILFCLWRIRRSWLRNISSKCHNIQIRREIFKHLGELVYGIWSGVDSVDALKKFIQDFVDQTAFMQYFKTHWVPKIEMWLAIMKTLPLASQEACSAIEAYHLKSKLALSDDSHLGVLQRVDWLVNKLITKLNASYWLDHYAYESDSFKKEDHVFQKVKYDYIASTSWHRALQIPDSSIILDDNDHTYVKVVSQKDSISEHIVWNPGSEFALCDCSWSMQGNLCKHVIKVSMILNKPSLSIQSFKETLMNLWQKPMDDSITLDQAVALTDCVLNQVQKLVELNDSSDVDSVVKNLPLHWVSNKSRTFVGKPSSKLTLPHKKKRKSNNVS